MLQSDSLRTYITVMMWGVSLLSTSSTKNPLRSEISRLQDQDRMSARVGLRAQKGNLDFRKGLAMTELLLKRNLRNSDWKSSERGCFSSSGSYIYDECFCSFKFKGNPKAGLHTWRSETTTRRQRIQGVCVARENKHSVVPKNVPWGYKPSHRLLYIASV